MKTTFFSSLNPMEMNESLQKSEKSILKMQIVTLDRDYSFYDLKIINDKKVWAVGSNGLFLSTEQGITKQKIADVEEFYTLVKVDFVDELNGWASGNHYVARTNDGGENWKATKLKTEVELSSLSFYNDKIGYAGGGGMIKRCRGCEIVHLPAEIWKTTDGGISWKLSHKFKNYVGTIFDIRTVNENVVVAIINAETLIRTDDAGRNWDKIATLRGIKDLALSPYGKVWTVGTGNILFSDDQGLTWKTPLLSSPDLIKHGWNTIKFADSSRGMIFGRNGKVAYTKDGGQYWQEIRTDVPRYVDELDNLIWADIKDGSGIVIGSEHIYKFRFPEN